jgi:hypothetical protein
MIRIDISQFVSQKVMTDIVNALKNVKHGVVRMIRIPVEDFIKACESVMRMNPFTPFSPVFLNIPCDQTANALPEIIVVHDDNTNGAVNILTELGV